MNLVIDFGNTFAKFALFEKEEQLELNVFTKNQSDEIIDFLNPLKEKVDVVIASSVIDFSEKVYNYLKQHFNFVEFTNQTPVPIINQYKTPETLGNDRLAAVIGANFLFPQKNILVIDAGTCITYEFINNHKEYLGGSISPGIKIRLKAVYNFTEHLPLINLKDFETLIGQNTEESILSGILNGSRAEADGIIERYKNTFGEIIVILTGGDAHFFDKKLKSSIFVVPNLVLIGLNVILNFNAKK